MSDNTTVLKSTGRKRPPAAGIGRKKGVPNKITKELKEMILGALSDVGGQKYLALQAKKQPVAFMALLGKVLPHQIAGDGGGPIHIHITDSESRL